MDDVHLSPVHEAVTVFIFYICMVGGFLLGNLCVTTIVQILMCDSGMRKPGLRRNFLFCTMPVYKGEVCFISCLKSNLSNDNEIKYFFEMMQFCFLNFFCCFHIDYSC